MVAIISETGDNIDTTSDPDKGHTVGDLAPCRSVLVHN